MKCIDPLVTGYERGTFEERSARTESSPRQSGKNSEDDSRANNNIRETLGILSSDVGDRFVCALGGSAAIKPKTNHISLAVSIYQALSSNRGQGS